MASTDTPSWDPHVTLELLSTERMTTYLTACNGQLNDAFALYQRNLDIAAALQRMTAMVEVVTRNAIDRQLSEWMLRKNEARDWFDLTILDQRAQHDIRTARERALRTRNTLTHGSITAELSFGFWRYLTTKRYLTTLWIPAIQYAFPMDTTMHEDDNKR